MKKIKKVLTNNFQYGIIITEREVMNMRTYYYEFADGYYCYTVGQMSKTELAWEKQRHGAVVAMRVA